MKVKELLSDESKWCKDVSALRYRELFHDYVPTFADGDEACRWCLSGALNRCYVRCSLDYEAALKKVHEAIEQLYPQQPICMGLPNFNDRPDITFTDIKAVLELADV